MNRARKSTTPSPLPAVEQPWTKTHGYSDEQVFKELTDLKQANSDLKILLAVGGWNFTFRGAH